MPRMRLALEHPWNLTPGEAIALQRELAARVETADREQSTKQCRFLIGIERTLLRCSGSAAVRCPSTAQPSNRELPALVDQGHDLRQNGMVEAVVDEPGV